MRLLVRSDEGAAEVTEVTVEETPAEAASDPAVVGDAVEPTASEEEPTAAAAVEEVAAEADAGESTCMPTFARGSVVTAGSSNLLSLDAASVATCCCNLCCIPNTWLCARAHPDSSLYIVSATGNLRYLSG